MKEDDTIENIFLNHHNLIQIMKGKDEKMSVELIKDFIGKFCYINLINEVTHGTIVSVEDNWLKLEVEDEKETRLINTNMITCIRLVKDKQ